ncbi:MAG: hypothetical protein WA144_15185 [Candidatus Methanoperedens sp.]
MKGSCIAKIKQKRGNDFKKGYEFILTNIERLGLPALEEIVYPDKEKHAERLYEFLYNTRNAATRMLLRQLIGYIEDQAKKVKEKTQGTTRD